MTKSKDDLDSALAWSFLIGQSSGMGDRTDVTEPDGSPVVDKFASVPTGERFPYSETPCPKCGNKTVTQGYGLAGGGIGTYWGCDSCDYFEKQHDE